MGIYHAIIVHPENKPIHPLMRASFQYGLIFTVLLFFGSSTFSVGLPILIAYRI